MGKDGDDILGGLVILAGLWLLGKALSSKKVDYFTCWNCKRIIAPNTEICPFCGVRISWGQTNERL